MKHDKEVFVFCGSLILGIVGLAAEMPLLYVMGFALVCGLGGWMCRGDENARNAKSTET